MVVSLHICITLVLVCEAHADFVAVRASSASGTPALDLKPVLDELVSRRAIVIWVLALLLGAAYAHRGDCKYGEESLEFCPIVPESVYFALVHVVCLNGSKFPPGFASRIPSMHLGGPWIGKRRNARSSHHTWLRIV